MLKSKDALSLREEIALIRICIEDRYNSCKTSQELMLHCGALNAMFMILEKLIATQARLDKEAAKNIPFETISDFAIRISDVIASECTPEQMKKITKKIAKLVKAKK